MSSPVLFLDASAVECLAPYIVCTVGSYCGLEIPAHTLSCPIFSCFIVL
jgi:hypothetical protein